jgi:transposase-like protein
MRKKKVTKKEQAKPVHRTPEQKRAMVHAFMNRGNKSTREAAAELGVSPQLLYSWQKLIDDGEPLMGEEGAEPIDDRLARAKERAKHTIIAHVEQAKTSGANEEILFNGASQNPLLEIAVLRSENTSLRVENDRLKKTVQALAQLIVGA